MQLLEVSGAVRHIYIYAIRRLKVKEWKSGCLEFLYVRFDFEADQKQASAHESIFLASHFYNNQVQILHPGCLKMIYNETIKFRSF